MEQLIIIGLLLIIILILLDRKFSINVRRKQSSTPKKNLPSIMGDTKKIERHSVSIDATERQYESTLMTGDNFESETKEEEVDPMGQTKNINDILVRNDEWEQEDEDWKYEDSTIEGGFATGVTFQELSTAGQLLQQDMVEPVLKQQAVDIIQRIQGTELFDLLENSLGDASKRIAGLLSESISNDVEGISSSYKDGVEGFDIGEFV